MRGALGPDLEPYAHLTHVTGPRLSTPPSATDSKTLADTGNASAASRMLLTCSMGKRMRVAFSSTAICC